MEWISVHQKMPEVNEVVMIYYRAYNIPHSEKQRSESWPVACLGYFNGSDWVHADGMGARVWYSVTHWMSIELPK